MALQHGLRTAWSVPIVSKNGELLGTFGLHHAQLKSVGHDEIGLLEKAGHIALIAIERARAQAALTDALAEVKKSEAELRAIVAARRDRSLVDVRGDRRVVCRPATRADAPREGGRHRLHGPDHG